MNKLLGDVTEKEKEIADQLVEFERQITKGTYPKEKKSQMYVCLAHDWYQLDMEEEGNRLILQAEKNCPGYFDKIMVKQTVGDESFRVVVKSLSRELASLLVHHINEIRSEE